MSCTAVGDDKAGVCANCGRTSDGEDGFVKLKYCTACRLVKYCGVECQKAHRKQHKKACKQRAAELKDEAGNQDSFSALMIICGACERTLPEGAYSGQQRGRRQSIRRCEECVAAGNQLVLMKKGRERSDEDECPICSLLSPLDWNQSSFKACCMKEVCDGCILAARKRGMEDCPFCRAHLPEEDGQIISMIERRVDPVAIWHLGGQYHDGQHGLEKDVARAVELWERAAELGVKEAHHNLGCLYDQGMGVEKDTAKMIQHWEAAAMRGHVGARFNIGNKEFGAGNYDIALQHWAIAAKLGEEHALGNVRWLFKEGLATKTVYAEALRGYQGAIKEMSSPDRDAAKALGD